MKKYCAKLFIFFFILLIASNAIAQAEKKTLFKKVKGAADLAEEKAAEVKKEAVEGEVAAAKGVPSKISAINIPEEFGIVKDSYKGVGDKLIVHIQDAHCNYEAQTNIYQMIKIMSEKNNLRLITVEGSEGVIDTTPFASFPDQKIKTEVAEYFMKKGRITGPEYLCITGDVKFDLFGIENREMYVKNLDAFKKTMPNRPKFEPAVKEFLNVIGELKPKIFSKELLTLDSKLEAYEKGTLGFSDYCAYLIDLAKSQKVDIAKFKNMQNFSTVSKLEGSIDFKKVDKERNDILESISAKLSKRDRSELVVKTTNYKNGKLTSGEYHSYIVNLAKGRKIDVGEFKNLDAYTGYMIAYEDIDHDILLKEKEELESAVKDTMYQNTEQKTLDDMNKVMKTIERYYKLEMSRDDLEFYEKYKSLFSFAKFIAFVGTYAHKYSINYNIPSGVVELDAYFKDFEEYYEFAKQRDNILVDNTLKRMAEDNTNIAVMVCGGFHTQGMMRILKEKKVSYVVLAPRITKEDPNNPYLDILLGRTSAFDDLFEGEETETEVAPAEAPAAK